MKKQNLILEAWALMRCRLNLSPPAINHPGQPTTLGRQRILATSAALAAAAVSSELEALSAPTALATLGSRD